MNNKVNLLVLAGGFGTRLKTVLNNTPKSLAPVGDKTFLYFLLKRWTSDNYNSITFLLHYEADQIKKYVNGLKKEAWLNGVDINYIEESTPLGTGGSIANAIKELKINDPFIVTNSDTWLFESFKGIEESHSNCIGLTKVDDATRFGSVGVQDGLITSFHEKSETALNKEKILINAGVYFLHPSAFFNNSKINFSIEKDVFPRLAFSKDLKPYFLNGSIIDIGIPEDYKRFCILYNQGNLQI